MATLEPPHNDSSQRKPEGWGYFPTDAETHQLMDQYLNETAVHLGNLRVSLDQKQVFNSTSLETVLNLTNRVLSKIINKSVLPKEPSSGGKSDSSTFFHPDNIIGRSKAMQAVYEAIHPVTESDTSVLILGESGVGKELVANAIHEYSSRKSKPFIKVNCAALPETLLESELFGHERGAFTGAMQVKKGRFEMADGGTLFLDEVGDFSPASQVKLLRVLQEKQFERLGSSQTIKSNVRIIAATNRNLERLIDDGIFRQDLYYRLNVFPIFVPPLRERITDIILLADYFIEKYNRILVKKVKRISTPAIDSLMSYHWPGNVRELENCIERAILLSKEGVIHGHHLPPSLQTADTSNTKPQGSLRSALAALERSLLHDALVSARGNMARAARNLGLSERIIRLRVEKYKMNSNRFKENHEF